MKVHREKLQIATKGPYDIIDITADVEKALIESGIDEGYALVFSGHTTCGVLIQERETGLLADIQTALSRLIPSVGYYRHNDMDIRTENLHDDEPGNAHAHIRQIIGGRSSESVPVAEGALQLGVWQRITVIEFDEARDRQISIQVCGI
ncbi:MAG: secondary thiamine-phosphate synthase enzyme YjbQ [Actinomycetota bacterium]